MTFSADGTTLFGVNFRDSGAEGYKYGVAMGIVDSGAIPIALRMSVVPRRRAGMI